MIKRGDILSEDVLFIILNLAFIIIMFAFFVKQSNNGAALEEIYAKKIALVLDSAKPGMEINIDIKEGLEADKEWFSGNFKDSVRIVGNEVYVKFEKDGGYSYSFFNDVLPSIDVSPIGEVYIVVN